MHRGDKRPRGKTPEQLFAECQSGPAPHLLMGAHTGPNAEDKRQKAAQAQGRAVLPPSQSLDAGTHMLLESEGHTETDSAFQPAARRRGSGWLRSLATGRTGGDGSTQGHLKG